MTKKQAIKLSIKHWQEMIAWAGKQNPKDYTMKLLMLVKINQSWKGSDCPLCEKYECDKCPLAEKYDACSSPLSPNNWRKVDRAERWGEWLKEAEIMLKQLKSLLGE